MQLGPSQGYTALQQRLATLPSDGRLRYNNYGKGVMFWETTAEAQRFVNEFQQVTSNDIYWFTDPTVKNFAQCGRFIVGQERDCTFDERARAANYGLVVDKMRALDAYQGHPRQPIWAFIEVGWPFSESAEQGGRNIAPLEIRAAVWHSIIAGARGIIYFNHTFGGPGPWSAHVLRDAPWAAHRAVVKATNAQIKALAPVLNSPTMTGGFSVSEPVRAMGKLHSGQRYIFAGSKRNQSSTATFAIEGATTGTAEVVGEGRTIPISGGQFSDTFADGNAIHIYRISP